MFRRTPSSDTNEIQEFVDGDEIKVVIIIHTYIMVYFIVQTGLNKYLPGGRLSFLLRR